MEELSSTVIRIIIYHKIISKSPPSFYRNATWLERTINIILTSTLEAICPHISDHLAVKQRVFFDARTFVKENASLVRVCIGPCKNEVSLSIYINDRIPDKLLVQ